MDHGGKFNLIAGRDPYVELLRSCLCTVEVSLFQIPMMLQITNCEHKHNKKQRRPGRNRSKYKIQNTSLSSLISSHVSPAQHSNYYFYLSLDD